MQFPKCFVVLRIHILCTRTSYFARRVLYHVSKMYTNRALVQRCGFSTHLPLYETQT